MVYYYNSVTNNTHVSYILYLILRFFLCVRLSVTEMGVAVTNLRVVCKIITCVSAFTFTELEMAIIIILLIFLEIVKTTAKLLLQVLGLDTLRYRLRE